MKTGRDVGQPLVADKAIDMAVPEDFAVLRTMLRLSNAVLSAQYFDEVLEVIAEQTLQLLGASVVSISRWERHDNVLRTLINVGDLAAGEHRWPDDDLFAIADDPDVRELLQRGTPYVHAVQDQSVDPAVRDYLREVGKNSEVAVPVMFDDAIWGEIWAAGTAGHRFGADDIQLLQAIAAYTAVAIGRGELFTTVWRHAHQDPLTDLANRRALEKVFREIDWQTASPTLLVGDLDGFKLVNDRDGHLAGDALLRGVARALSETASDFDDVTVARLGGDEFCVVLPRGCVADAERFAHAASRRMIQALGSDVTITWGAATAGSHVRSGRSLLAAADAALLHAKSLGSARFSRGAAERSRMQRRPARSSDRMSRQPAESLVSRVAHLIDAKRPLPNLAALECLAAEAQHSVAAAGWAVSVCTDHHGVLVTSSSIDSLQDSASGLWVMAAGRDAEVYRLSDYPASAHAINTGSAFVAALDDETSDPAELELLTKLGYRAVLVVGVSGGGHGYLVEIFSAVGAAELLPIATQVRVLAHYCLAVCGSPLDLSLHGAACGSPRDATRH